MFELVFYDRCEQKDFVLSTYDTEKEAEEKRLFVISKFKKEHRDDAAKAFTTQEYIPDTKPHNRSGEELLITLNEVHKFRLPVLDKKDILFV